jgi:O-antigen ligase
LNNKKLNYELRITNYETEYFIIYFIILTFLSALFFTFSRGAWIGAGVGILAMFILAIIKNDWLAQKKLLKIILLSGIFIFIASTVFSDLVSARTSANLRLEAKSNSERIESYKTSFKIIKNHWLFGTGIGNYTLAVHDEINPDLPGYAYQPAHDVFLLVWAETGVFGILFFVLLIAWILIFNFQFSPKGTMVIFKQFSIFQFFKFKNSLEIGNWKLKISQWFRRYLHTNYLSIALIFSMLILFTVDHWFWSLHFGVMLFWVVMGLLSEPPERH